MHDSEEPAALGVCEFAGPGPLRDRLVRAVMRGEKTATSSLLAQYGEGEALPRVGERLAVVSSSGEPVAVIEVTEVRIVPMGEIDQAFAVDEGEGFATVSDWRRAHERFWSTDDEVRALGVTLDDATVVVAERFRLVD